MSVGIAHIACKVFHQSWFTNFSANFELEDNRINVVRTIEQGNLLRSIINCSARSVLDGRGHQFKKQFFFITFLSIKDQNISVKEYS